MKNIRWGIIGCGDVTEVKSGPALQKAEGSQLVAVMRRDGDKARDYAQRHHVPRWYDDANALINDDEVDAIYIATPPSSHLEYCLLGAQAQKPIYVEKPMARNFEECNEMIAAYEAANVPLFVAYYRRALPRFVKVRELLEDNAIGEVRAVSVSLCQRPSSDAPLENPPWRFDPQIAGGGLFFDLASHTLDILDFLLGPITEVKGIASNQSGWYDVEDTVSANWKHESGAHGVGLWCFDADHLADRNEIIGSRGRIVFSTFGNEPIELQTSTETQEFALVNPWHIQQPLIQTVVDELNGKGVCPSKGESGARTNWVMDEILHAWRAKSNSK